MRLQFYCVNNQLYLSVFPRQYYRMDAHDLVALEFDSLFRIVLMQDKLVALPSDELLYISPRRRAVVGRGCI